MHFKIFVEDQSGKKSLEILLPKILEDNHTFEVYGYKGIGRIPKDMRDPKDASKRIFLTNLPKILQGCGKTFANYPPASPAAVVVVCDLDRKSLKTFCEELFGILNQCHPKPETRFCIAIEEGEAWFLGDRHAIKEAYPNAKDDVLDSYIQDSICGTWEKLADALYKGGSAALSAQGWQIAGREKSRWATDISPHMDVANNQSPSFRYFRDKLTDLANPEAGLSE